MYSTSQSVRRLCLFPTHDFWASWASCWKRSSHVFLGD